MSINNIPQTKKNILKIVSCQKNYNSVKISNLFSYLFLDYVYQKIKLVLRKYFHFLLIVFIATCRLL